MSEQRFATFTAGGLLLGLEVERVEEVLRDQEITPVPLADPGVLGLVNLRGRIVTAVDARHRLGLPARAAGDGERVHFIVRSDDEPVDLVVDGEGEVVAVDPATVEDVPSTVETAVRNVVVAAYQVGASLLLVLDAERALSDTAP